MKCSFSTCTEYLRFLFHVLEVSLKLIPFIEPGGGWMKKGFKKYFDGEC